MKETTEKLEGQLESSVADQGSNFSAGEKQLLCLARAMLSQKKILVLDEATANIDKQCVASPHRSIDATRVHHVLSLACSTDELIQDTIRSKFHDVTVLTIAHRLNTVMDSDKMLVLERGAVAEFDSPWQLICAEGTLFEMIESCGSEEAARLKRIARDKFESSRSKS